MPGPLRPGHGGAYLPTASHSDSPGAGLTLDFPLSPTRMAFWKKLIGQDSPSKVDYYQEGVELLGEGKFHDALTSFRLALKESPGDTLVLQQIAICYTRIGLTKEAAKTYRHVLQKEPDASGAHYGLAFILLRSGQPDEAVQHLEAFLADPPSDQGARDHVNHARSTLAHLRGEAHESAPEPQPPDERS